MQDLKLRVSSARLSTLAFRAAGKPCLAGGLSGRLLDTRRIFRASPFQSRSTPGRRNTLLQVDLRSTGQAEACPTQRRRHECRRCRHECPRHVRSNGSLVQRAKAEIPLGYIEGYILSARAVERSSTCRKDSPASCSGMETWKPGKFVTCQEGALKGRLRARLPTLNDCRLKAGRVELRLKVA